MKKPTQPKAVLIEALEPRLAPAGIVTVSVSGGVLTLTGDGADNVVLVSSPNANIWRLSDPDAGEQEAALDTKFRLAGQPDSAATATLDIAAAVAGVKGALNGGNDKLDLAGLLVNGAVTLQGGEGNDAIFISGIYNGAITLDGGNGNDDVGVISGFINNTLTVKTGAGDDDVFFGTGNYARGITTDLGTGSNTFSLLTSSTINVFGNLSITSAGGVQNQQNYFLGMKSGGITGNVSIKTSAGNASYMLGRDDTDTLSINGGLTITGSAGNDKVFLAGQVTVGGTLNAAMGAGTNFITNSIVGENDDSSQLKILGLGALAYTGGAGNDSIYLECPEIIIGGNFTTSMGAGENNVTLINSTGLLIGGTLAYTGGAANDTLEMYGANLTVGGKLTYKGAGSADADRVFITTQYATLNNVELTGGAKGRDIFYVGAPDSTGSALISILGNLVTNTGAGHSDVRITDAIVHGKVTHTSAVALAAEVDDTYIVEDSFVLGALSINTGGAANAAVFINDSVCESTVSITTGAGNDLVAFDTVTADSTRLSDFYGAVTISLGTGNDDWYVGSGQDIDTVGNQFRSKVQVDGGTGNNVSHFYFGGANNNFFEIQPVFKGVMAYE